MSGGAARSWLGLAAVVAALDQAGKWLALTQLPAHQPLAAAPHLNLTLVYNQGAAFGFLAAAGGWQRWLFIAVAAAVCLYLYAWLRRLPRGEGPAAAGIALIIGGAVGNLIDRVWRGHVVDFIDVYYEAYHWPAFNVADAAIAAGALLLIGLALVDPGRMR